MEFNVNSPILFVIVGVIVLVVLVQSVFFLVRALKRSKELGMDQKKIKRTMISSALFTIAPAVAIVIGVITLSQSLGIPLPWLRLSVVGSLSYETVAAQNALSGMGMTLSSSTASQLDATQFVTVATVMTLSIIIGMILLPLFGKKLHKGMLKMESKDKKWGDIFNTSLFMGMISAFLGLVFCDFTGVFQGETKGLIPVFVMIASAIIMILCGALQKLTKWKWINDYALPLSLVLGMASAIPITAWLG